MLRLLRCPSSVDGRGRVLLDRLPRDGVRARRVSRGECTLLDVNVAGCVAHRMDPWTPARIEVTRCRVRRDGCRVLVGCSSGRPTIFSKIRPSFLGSSSSLFGSACDSGQSKIEDLAFRHRLVCRRSYTWSIRSIPTLLTPSIQLRAAVYFTRDHVQCRSFLHSFVTMTAISCAPTVRATAAPKVAIRRSNVRAAATGIRTQFGAVKGFAPVG